MANTKNSTREPESANHNDKVYEMPFLTKPMLPLRRPHPTAMVNDSNKEEGPGRLRRTAQSPKEMGHLEQDETVNTAEQAPRNARCGCRLVLIVVCASPGQTQAQDDKDKYPTMAQLNQHSPASRASSGGET